MFHKKLKAFFYVQTTLDVTLFVKNLVWIYKYYVHKRTFQNECLKRKEKYLRKYCSI